VYADEQYQFVAKEKAYNGALFENGFPEELLDEENDAYLTSELQVGGKILEALKAEYENAIDAADENHLAVTIKNDNLVPNRRAITVTVGKEKRSFNFDGDDSKQQYKEMKEFLTKAKLSTSLIRDPRAVPNSVDDWGEINDRKNTHHTAINI
jgi:hypothetical protein